MACGGESRDAVGLPLVTAVVLSKLAGDGGDQDFRGAITGLVVGGVAAIVIDDGWLAGGDPAPTPGPTVTPTVSPVPGGAMVGLGGAF